MDEMEGIPAPEAPGGRPPAVGTVAVIAAFRAEVEAVAAALADAGPLERAGFCRFVRGRAGARAVVAAAVGMGKVRAAAGTQAVLDRFRPAAVLFCGTAGSLAREVRPLDLVVAERLLQHDTGPKAPEWLEADPGLSALLLESARAVAAERGRGVHAGGLITGDRPVLRRAERNALRKRFAALAVDMEAAAAAAVAAAAGVPFAAVKAVTDSADRKGILEFKLNAGRASALAAGVVNAFLERRSG